MAISGTTTNYTGRTKDLFISQGIKPTVSTVQPVTYTFGRVSSYVAGVQKLIQRFVISLINTGLIAQLQSQQGSNIQDATHIFNFACWTVITTFKAYQDNNPGQPTDEQLATAVLTDISASPGNINMTVQLVTQAGTDIIFVLPVPLQ